jgi:pimeloyl-ACP methyl ester carboxylesterase
MIMRCLDCTQTKARQKELKMRTSDTTKERAKQRISERWLFSALFIPLLLVVGCTYVIQPDQQQAQNQIEMNAEGETTMMATNTSTLVESGYAPVNGLNMYYEIHGERQGDDLPLVLLHGAFSSIEPDFGLMLPIWAKSRQLIAVEQQGHGHTADIDRPLRYDQMAEDTVALLQHLGIEKADFFGYSFGSEVALKIAYHHPEIVRKVVAAGGVSYNLEGLHPEAAAAEGESELPPDALDGTPWKEAYEKVAPNPENWPQLIARINDLNASYQPWTEEQVRSIKAPLLLMVGDSDIVRPEHVVEMFRLVGGGVPGDLVGVPASQLAILPGTTHVTLMYKPEWVTSMTNEFLNAPMPDAQ